MFRPVGQVKRFSQSRGSSQGWCRGVLNITGRAGPGRAGSGRVGSGRVGSGRVGSGRVGSGTVRSGRVESTRVESGHRDPIRPVRSGRTCERPCFFLVRCRIQGREEPHKSLGHPRRSTRLAWTTFIHEVTAVWFFSRLGAVTICLRVSSRFPS